MFGNTASNKSNIYDREWSKFDREIFILDYFSIGWGYLLKIDGLNVDNSTQMYLEKINILLDTYVTEGFVRQALPTEMHCYTITNRYNKSYKC